MANKILSTVLIMTIIYCLFSVPTCKLYYILPQEAIAHINKILTYENSTYGIRMQYPSNWLKEENISGYDNNSMLVDVVRFISSTNNASDASESLDLKIDNISDISLSL